MGPHKLHQGIYKRSVQDLAPREVRNKTVFLRCDLNVPLTDDLEVSDDTRIREAVPTIKILLANRAKVLLASHLVRTVRLSEPLASLRSLFFGTASTFYRVVSEWSPLSVSDLSSLALATSDSLLANYRIFQTGLCALRDGRKVCRTSCA